MGTKDTPVKPEKRYKAIMIEDGSTLMCGLHPLTLRKTIENSQHYHVLKYGVDYKIVRDLKPTEPA